MAATSGRSSEQSERNARQSQTLARAMIPNYASAAGLAAPKKDAVITMMDRQAFSVRIWSLNGEHRNAVREVASSLQIRPAIVGRFTGSTPVGFSKRQFKDSCLVRLGGPDAELAVDVDFSSLQAKRKPKTLEDVLWYIVDYYKLIRSQAKRNDVYNGDTYDISYGWVAEQRGSEKAGDLWHLVLRFRTESMADEGALKPRPDERWTFAPESRRPDNQTQASDQWAQFRCMDEEMNAVREEGWDAYRRRVAGEGQP